LIVDICYELLEQNQIALDYYRQTLNIYENDHYSNEHPSRVLVENKILDVSCKLAIKQFELEVYIQIRFCCQQFSTFNFYLIIVEAKYDQRLCMI